MLWGVKEKTKTAKAQRRGEYLTLLALRLCALAVNYIELIYLLYS
jgi:hypothetical protein